MELNLKHMILMFLKKATHFILILSQKNKILRRFMDIFGEENSKNIKEIKIKNDSIFFYEVNSVTKYRNDTFFTKEPETLEWIDKFPKNCVFWDVGANVGLYSIYAGKTKNCQVTAIEPSVFNLELLAKNIYLNSLNKQINILPIGLSKKSQISNFHSTSILNGGALSSLEAANKIAFEQSKDQCDYKIPVLTLDLINSIFNIPNPKYLKIDVDGLEYEILLGAKSVLKNLKSLLIEVDKKDLKKVKMINALLKQENFKLIEEGKELPKISTINQIWEK
jgi:FkbM family methyltransferase